MELLTVLTWTGPNSTPQQNDGIWLQLNQKQSRHTAYTAYLLNTHLIPSRAAYLLNASHPLLSLTHVVLQVYSIPSTPENCSCVWMNALTNKQESIHGHSVDIHTTKAQHPFQPALTVTRRVADDLQHLCLCLLSVSVHHSASIIVIALELESSISAKPISHCKWNHCQDEQNRDSSYWSIQDRVSCVWCIFVPERFCRWLYNWFILQVLCSILSIVYICVMGICCPAKPSHSCFYCRYECFKQEHTISLFLITLLLIFSVLVSVVSLILSSSLWRSTTVIFRS